MRISSCSDESSNSHSSQQSDKCSSPIIANAQSSRKQPSLLVTFPKEDCKAVSGKSSIK